MLTYTTGNLLTSPAQVLVNPVNTVGVMGKSLALAFAQGYPGLLPAYRTACHRGQLAIGRPWVYRTGSVLIVNFPTKRHWRDPSRLADIEAGLRAFGPLARSARLTSAAFPALGCGRGGLPWDRVRPLMSRYLAPPPLDVFIYAPPSVLLGRRTASPNAHVIV